MSFFTTLRQKATFIDKITESFGSGLTRAEKFKLDYKLPPEEAILDEINADIAFIGIHDINIKSKRNEIASKQMDTAYLFSGKLYLTPHFLVFKDSFDQESYKLVLTLSTVKRMEKSPAASYTFSLILTLYSGSQLIIDLIGLKYRSEQFCESLKTSLKGNIPNAKLLSTFLDTSYSEFLIRKNARRMKDVKPPKGGLGQQFKYPGNLNLNVEKVKLKRWFDYFRENGQNVAMIRNKNFQSLIRIGVPNRLRGEIWDICSGAIYLRQINPGVYDSLLKDNIGKKSQAIDEIEKDLKRSLPEYQAYQTEEGIARLRNVLTAYSWKNPDVGYCQAMNIVVAALLIYMTEEQAFWCLCNICDIFVPGYYSKTMYGTLLDQRVFESFVEEKLPVLWDYIVEHDIQLSIISLPWFLSLFYTSMPLEYAIRIMDMFFLYGAKALFQVSLAVLKINADDILQADDDGMFIAIIKHYFRTLDDSAFPDSEDPKRRQITKFQELLVTAFKEFSIVTDASIAQERNTYKKGIFQNIEIFVKKTQLRHMPRVFNLNDEELSHLYDIFYETIETHQISMGTGSSNMPFAVFMQFMTKICEWCKINNENNNLAFVKQKTNFLRVLFDKWDSSKVGELTLNDIVNGFDKLCSRDLLESINYFFTLYDNGNTGLLPREKVLQISEGLLFLTEPWKSGRIMDKITLNEIEEDIGIQIANEQQDKEINEEIELPTNVMVDQEKYTIRQTERYLEAASNFLKRSMEYCLTVDSTPVEIEVNLIEFSDNEEEPKPIDPLKREKKFTTLKANAALDPTRPKFLDVASFRMVILADETYELFFTDLLRTSIHLDSSITTNNDKSKALRGMFDGIIADGRRVAAQVRRRRADSSVTGVSSANISTSNGNSTNNGSSRANNLGAENASVSTSIPTTRYDDIEDFTNEQYDDYDDESIDESDALLKNVWADDDTNKGKLPSKQKERPLQSLASQTEDLIEFEA